MTTQVVIEFDGPDGGDAASAYITSLRNHPEILHRFLKSGPGFKVDRVNLWCQYPSNYTSFLMKVWNDFNRCNPPPPDTKSGIFNG